MSAIVAIKDNETKSVWMASDSQLTSGCLKTNIIGNKNNYKIFRNKKDKNLLIGVCGLWADLSILRTIRDIIPFPDKGRNNEIIFNYNYVVNTIKPRIFEILDKNNRINYESGLGIMESEILIAYKDKLFQIGCSGAVTEIDEYVAIGAGRDFCYGSLYSTKYINLIPQEKCCLAIKSACEHSIMVDYPIIYTNTMWNNDGFNDVGRFMN